MSSTRPKRAVLVGAGHAHLDALKHAGRFTSRGFELVLVAPGDFWYSGLATGMLGGLYSPGLDRVDVGALIARGGGRFVRDSVVRIDPAARTLTLASGDSIDYDAVSLDVGSRVPTERIPGLADHATAVKPIANLDGLRRELEPRFATASPASPVRLAIVGDGPTACEVAGNARRLADDRGGALAVTVLAAADRLLPKLGRAAECVSESMGRRGVRVRTGARVSRVEAGVAHLDDGSMERFDLLIAAIGLVPPDLARGSGLPVDESGAMRVDACLRSVADPTILGGGDCVAFPGRDLAKVGVYAVRQAPVLTHNLLACLEGRAPRRFRPQRRFLLILNLGDGTGLATWGPLHWQGRAAFWLKDRIDRRFLSRYHP
jgi:NADH dehydrogenase FAD-containing subunit